jgi:D-amino-acid dehydrogenase
MHDVIVIGGGIVGSSAAYHLSRAGADALLVDRHDEGRATDAGAGILSPPTSSRSESDEWFEFAVDAVGYYDDLADRLEAEQDGEHGYEPCDLLSVALDDDSVSEFEAVYARTQRRSDRLGRPPAGTFDEISPERARALFPPLADPARALHFEDAGRVDGATFTAALRRAAAGHGLSTRSASVERIRVEDGTVAGVVADGDAYAADAVIVAGGAWSASFGEQLGVDVPVEPHRGQIAHLSVDADTGDWPIVGVLGHNYLVPWPDGRVAVGATREADSGFDPRTTVGGVHELLDAAIRVAPDLADATLESVRVGLRPVAPDGLPILGGVPGVDGAYLATGHGATGLMLGPYSGKLVADLALGDTVPTALRPFGVTRFD